MNDVPILVEEHMAIGAGIKLAKTRKLRNIKVESDEIPVIRAINGEIYCPCLIILEKNKNPEMIL